MHVALLGDFPLELDRTKNGPQAVFKFLVDGLQQIPALQLSIITAHKSVDKYYVIQEKGITFHYLL